MCGTMVDIQSPTAEIRRGEKKKNKSQHEHIMVCPITQGDHTDCIARLVKWSLNGINMTA